MPSAPVLTIAFLEHHPGASARTLAEMDNQAAAAFLNTLPTRVLVNVFSNMGASSAANILAHMESVTTAAVFRAQDYLLATTILRLIPTDSRTEILEQLPQKLKRDLEQSLSFPPDTVGAHMITSVIILGEEATVADARRELMQSPNALAELVFIVGSNRKLSGVVRSVLLFQHADDVKLMSFMDNNVPTLSARSKRETASEGKVWDTFGALPVLSRKKHLIGALRRDTTAQIDQLANELGSGSPSVIVSLIEIFLASIAGLIDVLTGARHRTKPIKSEKMR